MKGGFFSFFFLTHRPIELSFLIHAEVESSVHPSDADQAHCQADELQDTWGQTMNTPTHNAQEPVRKAHKHTQQQVVSIYLKVIKEKYAPLN